jgi:hypothetical protein
MLMYFAVKGIGDHDFRRIIRLLIALQVACALIGIALFFLQPDYYSEFLRDKLGVSENWQIYGRLQSYMGSTATGILSAVAIVLLLNVKLLRLSRYALWLLLLLTILLTQQRGAYVSGLLATLYLLYKARLNPLQLGMVLVLMCAVLLAALNYLGLTADLFVGAVQSRIVEDLIFGDPLGERVDAYQKGLSFLSEFPLGLGLGATTSAAQDAGAHFNGQVVDAYYMRIACDLGVIGLVLFVAVLVLATYSSVRNGLVHGFALIVIIYAIQSTGTNVLDSYYVSHVFWLLLGYVGATSNRAVNQAVDGRVARARLLELQLEGEGMRRKKKGPGP